MGCWCTAGAGGDAGGVLAEPAVATDCDKVPVTRTGLQLGGTAALGDQVGPPGVAHLTGQSALGRVETLVGSSAASD